MRSKYVDDTTAFEIIPRNSTSILDLAVGEICPPGKFEELSLGTVLCGNCFHSVIVIFAL